MSEASWLSRILHSSFSGMRSLLNKNTARFRTLAIGQYDRSAHTADSLEWVSIVGRKANPVFCGIASTPHSLHTATLGNVIMCSSKRLRLETITVTSFQRIRLTTIKSFRDVIELVGSYIINRRQYANRVSRMFDDWPDISCLLRSQSTHQLPIRSAISFIIDVGEFLGNSHTNLPMTVRGMSALAVVSEREDPREKAITIGEDAWTCRLRGSNHAGRGRKMGCVQTFMKVVMYKGRAG